MGDLTKEDNGSVTVRITPLGHGYAIAHVSEFPGLEIELTPGHETLADALRAIADAVEAIEGKQ